MCLIKVRYGFVSLSKFSFLFSLPYNFTNYFRVLHLVRNQNTVYIVLYSLTKGGGENWLIIDYSMS